MPLSLYMNRSFSRQRASFRHHTWSMNKGQAKVSIKYQETPPNAPKQLKKKREKRKRKVNSKPLTKAVKIKSWRSCVGSNCFFFIHSLFLLLWFSPSSPSFFSSFLVLAYLLIILFLWSSRALFFPFLFFSALYPCILGHIYIYIYALPAYCN